MTEKTNPRYPRGSESQTGPADKTTAGPSLACVEQTAEEILTILPKGFVENTAEIYAEVASYDVLPPEKLREYWRVYTITNRRLCDPTAKRLESFWWHVWGSKLRYSSGDTLAKLYESISTGPTFVPLRGPANRYEGPSIPVLIQQQKLTDTRKSSRQPSQVDPSNSSRAAYSEDRDRVYNGGTKNRSTNAAADDAVMTQHSTDITATVDNEDRPQAPVKALSSSASRPAPPQSILRKPRPSLAGSRPTPRFTLPADIPTRDGSEAHASGGTEDIVGSSSLASGSGSASSGLAEPSPSSAGSSRSSRKQTRTKPTKKKFVAASTKRKAFVLKRSGSQVLSAASDAVGQQETRRLQSPKSPLGDHPTSGEIIEQIILLPPEPELTAPCIPPEDGQVTSRSHQQQQFHVHGTPSPSMRETGTTDKQTAHSKGSPNSRSAAGKLADLQGIDSPLADVSPKALPETRFEPRSPGPVVPPLVRSTASSARSSALHITVGSREIPSRPSGRLIRQMTLPQGIGQSAAPASAARSFPDPSTSMESTMSRPSTPGAGSFIAPMLSRSTSQDGSAFWSRRSGETVSSPTGMGAAALATPSMVAARGVFSDAEGPDPFRMYATTGLNDHLEEEEDDQQGPSFTLERSSFSYTDPNPLHRPLFTPTRPSPTPRIPFARTRSQLNVILDREKARLGQGPFDSWQESRTGRDPSEPRAVSYKPQHNDQTGSSVP